MNAVLNASEHEKSKPSPRAHRLIDASALLVWFQDEPRSGLIALRLAHSATGIIAPKPTKFIGRFVSNSHAAAPRTKSGWACVVRALETDCFERFNTERDPLSKRLARVDSNHVGNIDVLSKRADGDSQGLVEQNFSACF